MFNKILVPMDGSKHAQKAAHVAVDLAKKYDSRVIFMTVTRKFEVSDNLRRFMQAENLMGEPQYLIDEMTKHIMKDAKDYAKQEGLSRCEVIVREGQPARTIVEYARDHDIDLIIMGSRGLGDVEGALLGSVSHKVSNLASCMVTTVK